MIERFLNIKVPVPEYREYYISTVLGYKPNKEKKELYEELKKLDVDLEYERNKDVWYCSKVIRDELADKVNNVNVSPPPFSKKKFKPFEDGKEYVSIDLKQANWSAIRRFVDPSLPLWEEYAVENLGMLPEFAKDKMLRQIIIGKGLNGKRLEQMQRVIISEVIEAIPDQCSIDFVSNDEVIVSGDTAFADNLSFDFDIHINRFVFRRYDNYGDSVKVFEYIDSNKDILYKKLYCVDGQRWFIHFKTLILEENINIKDRLYTENNQVVEYFGKDFKEKREYDYVRKYAKPLMWEYYDTRDPMYSTHNIPHNTFIIRTCCDGWNLIGDHIHKNAFITGTVDELKKLATDFYIDYLEKNFV